MPDEPQYEELTSIDYITAAYYAIEAVGSVTTFTQEDEKKKKKILTKCIDIIDKCIDELHKGL